MLFIRPLKNSIWKKLLVATLRPVATCGKWQQNWTTLICINHFKTLLGSIHHIVEKLKIFYLHLLLSYAIWSNFLKASSYLCQYMYMHFNMYGIIYGIANSLTSKISSWVNVIWSILKRTIYTLSSKSFPSLYPILKIFLSFVCVMCAMQFYSSLRPLCLSLPCIFAYYFSLLLGCTSGWAPSLWKQNKKSEEYFKKILFCIIYWNMPSEWHSLPEKSILSKLTEAIS